MAKKFYQTDSFKVGLGLLIGTLLYKIVMGLLSK
jgi:hypothetical protein